MSSDGERLLFIANSLNTGGAERTLIDLALRLKGNGYEPKVLCLHQAGSNAQGLAGKIPVENLGLRYRTRLSELLRLRRAIRRERPALIQCFHTAANRWGPLAARLAGVRSTVVGLQNVVHGQPRWEETVDRLSFRLAAHAVGCSEAVRRFHVQEKRYPPSKVSTIYNGVDVARFQAVADRGRLRRELGLVGDRVLVGTVAALIPQKGHHYLLEAAQQVVEAVPQAAFILAGDGNLRQELEGQAQARGLQGRVLFLGVRQDIPEVLAALDIFALPSLWEGFGIAIIEAMASGLPVVATAVDGIVEIVVDGETGLLVAPKDPEALARAICGLAGDPEGRRRLGGAGRQRVARRFSIEATVEGYRRVYDRLLQGRRP